MNKLAKPLPRTVVNGVKSRRFILAAAACAASLAPVLSSFPSTSAAGNALLPAGATRTFAVATTSLTVGRTAVDAGAMYVVADSRGASLAIQDYSATVHIPKADATVFTVAAGSRVPPRLIGGKVIQGYDLAGTSTLAADTGDGISIDSPLWYTITGRGGALASSFAPAVVKDAHARGVQVWPIISSGFDPSRTDAVLSNPRARANLLAQIVSCVKRGHFDGIDLDFEDMKPRDAPLFSYFTRQVGIIMHTMGKGLCVDVTPPSPDPAWGLVYDRAALARSADYLAVMTYDQHFAGTAAGSVSTIPWMESGIRATVADGVPAREILEGVPFYTRLWYHANGAPASRVVSMGYALGDLGLPGATETWNAQDGQDVLTFTYGGISYTSWLENARSLRRRGAYVRTAGLGGAAIWDLAQGNASDVGELSAGWQGR